MTGQLLTVEEVADRLRKSSKTVRRYLREGMLTGIGGGDYPWRVPEESLDEFLEAHSNTPLDKAS